MKNNIVGSFLEHIFIKTRNYLYNKKEYVICPVSKVKITKFISYHYNFKLKSVEWVVEDPIFKEYDCEGYYHRIDGPAIENFDINGAYIQPTPATTWLSSNFWINGDEYKSESDYWNHALALQNNLEVFE